MRTARAKPTKQFEIRVTESREYWITVDAVDKGDALRQAWAMQGALDPNDANEIHFHNVELIHEEDDDD
jgi:hypothetical protein